MNRRSVALAVFLYALLAPTAFAWDDTGHELVAGIAWDNMKPSVRKAAIAVLNGAPSSACLKSLFPTDSRSLAKREREFFIRAATWPDLIRDGACKNLSQPSWHFADHFWKGVSGGTGDDAPKDAGIPTPSPNAITQLTAFEPLVACETKPCASKAIRAEDLAWILHLVGDVHQPLHNAARVTTDFPNGDRGGNEFLLGPKKTPLHTYWDHIVDNSVPIKPAEKVHHAMPYILRLAAAFEQHHPRAGMESALKDGDFAAWSDEGFKSAEDIAYPSSLTPKSKTHPAPTEAYRKQVFAICEPAIALAGYRLADLLTKMLAP